MEKININGTLYDIPEGATILDILNQNSIPHPQICRAPIVDPIQTCDTCIVEVDGELVRSCSTKALDGMNVKLDSDRARVAEKKRWTAFLKITYCTAPFATITMATVFSTTQR